jgi:SAM-dependent methyltransferase
LKGCDYLSTMSPRIRNIQSFCFNYLNGYEIKNILDVGIGDGLTARSVFFKLFNINEYYGLEKIIPEKQIPGVNYIGQDLNWSRDRIPLSNESIDLVFAGEIIEHLVDPDKFLNECYRILRPGGYIIITTPNLASWFNRIALMLGYQPFLSDVSFQYPHAGKMQHHCGGGDHLRVFTLRALKYILKMHEFTILKICGTCAEDPKIIFPFPFSPLIIIERLSWLFPGWSSDMILFCKK